MELIVTCQHGYPRNGCWTCNPDILVELHKLYETNIPLLERYASKYPSLVELYQDVKCMGTVCIDWESVFEECRGEEMKHGNQEN
jgi:hypothetical protein